MASYPLKKRENFLKMSMAIVDLSTDTLRVTLDSHTKQKDIKDKLCKCLNQPNFNEDEQSKINQSTTEDATTVDATTIENATMDPTSTEDATATDPTTTEDATATDANTTEDATAMENATTDNAFTEGSYKDFDISLLYKILRCVCNQDIYEHIDPGQLLNNAAFMAVLAHDEEKKVKKIAKEKLYSRCTDDLLHKLYTHFLKSQSQLIHPSKGWGKTPDDIDTTLGDDIERIRELRNSVYGHIPSTEVSDTEFESYWKQLTDIMNRMNTHLQRNRGSKDFEKDLDVIKSSSMDEEREKFYIDEIKRLAKNEEKMEKRIDGMEKNVTNLNEKTKQITITANTRHEQIQRRMADAEGAIETLQENVVTLKDRAEVCSERSESTDISSTEEIYDVLILHADEDRSKAIEFYKILKTDILVDVQNLKICLFEEFAPDIQSLLQTMSVVFERCRYLFVYVTENFKEADVKRQQNEIALISNVKEKNRIIPVWTCENAYKLVPEFGNFKGINFSLEEIDQPVRNTVKNIILNGRKTHLIG